MSNNLSFQVKCANCKEKYTITFDNQDASPGEYALAIDDHLLRTPCEVCGKRKLKLNEPAPTKQVGKETK